MINSPHGDSKIFRSSRQAGEQKESGKFYEDRVTAIKERADEDLNSITNDGKSSAKVKTQRVLEH